MTNTKIEIHLIQSFPPANLNRDENNMPKSTVFGGQPRARISSQCQKRAVRKFYQENSDLSSTQLAHRSRSWMPELKKLLVTKNIPEIQAEVTAKLALEVLGAKVEESKTKSKTILFLGRIEIEAIADIIHKNWLAIEPALQEKDPKLPIKDPNIPKIIEKVLADNNKPGDVALFGRMMASLPSINVDASVQMAHAIGINKLQQEFDFFTAVDDLKDDLNTVDEDQIIDQGADHLGETGYNSSTYYRYANLDIQQLKKNLGDKTELRAIIMAFADAFIRAIPSGHQNGFAAHSLPSLVAITVRKGQPISLVDAFEKPIRPSKDYSLLDNAVLAIDEYWRDFTKFYGDQPEYLGVVTRSKLAKHLTSWKAAEKDSIQVLLAEACNKALEG